MAPRMSATTGTRWITRGDDPVLTLTEKNKAETPTGLDAETLTMMLDAIKEYFAHAMPQERQLQLDHDDVCPEDLVRAMCSDELGVHLLFVPEEYGGMGGDTMDNYRVCEHMARLDLGLGTSLFATFLGSDPIAFGGTPEQKRTWLGEIAERGIAVRLRRHRARGGQRPRGAEDHRDARRRRRPGHRIPAYRPQAVDQQWRHRRQIHHPGQGAGRPDLVRPRPRHGRVQPEQARGQARHPAVQYRGTVPRRRGRARRQPGGRHRGAGPLAGAEGLRLHPRDGRRLRPRSRLVRA